MKGDNFVIEVSSVDYKFGEKSLVSHCQSQTLHVDALIGGWEC